MSDGTGPTRRTILEGAGVAAGTVALGGMGYATARAPSSSPPGVEWTREIGARSITQGNDGGYGVLGPVSLDKLGPDGDTQWTRTFTREEDEFYYYPDFVAICPGRDGGFVITGLMGGRWDGIAVKLAPDGTTVWRHRYTDIEGGYPLALVQRSDVGYAIATGNNRSGPRNAGILLLDEAGEVEANQRMEPETDRYRAAAEDERFAGFVDIARTGEGGYAIAGVVQYDNYTTGAWHLSLDTALNKDWEYTPENTDFPGGVISLGDEVAFTPGLAGQTTSKPPDEFGFSTYTSSGDVSGVHEYYGQDASSIHITKRTTGEIVLAGYEGGGAGRRESNEVFLGAGKDGEKHWNGEVTVEPNPTVRALISTTDGGLAGVGTTYDGEDQRPFVAKFSFDESRRTDTETATESDPDPETETATDPDPETETAPESDPDHDPETEPATESATRSRTASESVTETETTTSRETESGSATSTDDESDGTSPAGPGFGPLAALGGLGLGAWRLLRRSDDS